MKPVAIVFLCIALVIAGSGFLLCRSAERRAEADGVELFNISIDPDGNRVSSLTYDTSKMEKISISLKKGTVNILEGDSCRVEVYNLLEGSYVKGISNNVLQINDTLGLADIIKEGGLGISFSGIRNYLHAFKPFTYDKWINLYIPRGTPLNAVEVTVLEGDIVMKNVQNTQADLFLTAKNGKITVENCSTDNRMQLSAEQGSLSVSGGFANDLRATASGGSIRLTDKVSFVNADLRTEGEGDIELSLFQGISRMSVNLTAGNGISLNGTSLGTNEYTTVHSGGQSLTVSAKGAIRITD